MSRLGETLRALGRDQRGGSIVMISMALAVVLGVAALVVDMGFMYVKRGQLQSTADAAALAAAAALPDTAAARAAALSYAGKNMSTGVHGNVLLNADVVFGSWDAPTRTFSAGGTPANAVTVTTRQSDANGNAADTFFGALMGFDSLNVSAAATASAESGAPGCIVALDPGATAGSLSFQSMDSVELNDCVPVANSTHSAAIEINSLDSFHAGSLYSAGGYDASSIDTFDLDQPAETNQPPYADPYAGLADPTYGPCDYVNHAINSGGPATPGVYCGGLDVNASGVVFDPGTYYIVDGDLTMNSVSNVTCNCAVPGSGVTFVLTGTTPAQIGAFSIGGSDNISLQAPSDPSYDYPGVLIYVDRDSPYQTSSFSSIDNLTFNGALYAPTQRLAVSSIDHTAQTDCAQIVAFRVDFSSIDSFGRADNCGAYGTTQIAIGGSRPRLVN